MTKKINGWVQRSNWCCFMLISLGVHTYVAFQSLFLPFPVIRNHIDCLLPSLKFHVLFIPFFGFLWICFHPAKKTRVKEESSQTWSHWEKSCFLSLVFFSPPIHWVHLSTYSFPYDFSHVSAFNSGPVSSNSLSTRRQRFPKVFMALLCSTASLAAASFDDSCASRCRAWGQGLQRQQPAILSWEAGSQKKMGRVSFIGVEITEIDWYLLAVCQEVGLCGTIFLRQAHVITPMMMCLSGVFHFTKIKSNVRCFLQVCSCNLWDWSIDILCLTN